MNKKEWFENLIEAKDKLEKAQKSSTNAHKREKKALEHFRSFSNSTKPKSITEGHYKVKGHLIEVYSWGDVDIEVEPKYNKV